MNNLKDFINKQLIKIKEEPVRAFALLYPYILVIGIAIGLYYMGNMDKISKQNVPVVLPDTTKVEDLKIVTAKEIPPIDVFTLSEPTELLINKGKTLYNTNCASCHGEQGKGDGAGGAALNPPPRNLTLKDGWKNGNKISQIYQTLQEGIAGTGMIAYDFMLPEDRLAIIHYIRSSFIPDAPKDSKDELTALDQTYNLSRGMQISPQIPVSAAIEILLAENDIKVNKVNSIIQKIQNDKLEKGAEIFNRITYDPVKAVTTLMASSNWHQNQQKFVSVVIEALNHGGFSNKANYLTKEEWNALFNYLIKVI